MGSFMIGQTNAIRDSTICGACIKFVSSTNPTSLISVQTLLVISLVYWSDWRWYWKCHCFHKKNTSHL